MTSAKRKLDTARTPLIHRRTKIVATVGPASSTQAMLEKLITAGVNVFRLNFSHGTHETHAQIYANIRAASDKLECHVGVLADMCGPKIRCGHFKDGGIDLVPGEAVTVTVRKVEGEPGLIPTEYDALAGDVDPGDRILMNDGVFELEVTSVEGTEIRCVVKRGGRLTNRKGINLPGVKISTPSVTEKDKRDARFAAGLGVDFMALSFVRSGDDVRELRALLTEVGRPDLPIISKIEKPEALDNIDDILKAGDGIMIARGDLGVELPAEEVPIIQQSLVELAVEANQPVIVATQMLESMIGNARPTRAEVTDVAHAAMAGTDAVMLSGETAAGKYPVEAVETMNRVLRLVEGWQWHHHQFGQLVEHSTSARQEETTELQLSEAMARATAQLSRELQARAIVVPSNSGFTARMVAAERPQAPIIVAAADPGVCRRLALSWGVRSHHLPEESFRKPLSELATDLVHTLDFKDRGEFVLLVHGEHPHMRQVEPSISLLKI